MRTNSFLLFCLLLCLSSIPLNAKKTEFNIIDPKWDNHFSPIKTSNATILPQLLTGEYIYFQKNSNSFDEYELNQFLNITPDTIWIKRKKNPKLNKHYRLMPCYHGIEITKYGVLRQYTPFSEIENVIFRVDSISEIKKDTTALSTTSYCDVYLFNTKTSDHLIWRNRSKNNAMLTVYSNSLGARIVHECPSFYMSEKSSSYSRLTTADYSKFSIDSAIYHISINGWESNIPHMDIHLSSASKSKKLTYPYTGIRPNIISAEQYQAMFDKELEASKVYKINSKCLPLDSAINFPFSFRFILGNTTGGYVHQTINNTSSYYVGEYLSSGNTILIADKQKMHGSSYYIGLFANKCFYIPVKDVVLSDVEKAKLDTLLSCDQSKRNQFFSWAKSLENYHYTQKTNQLLKELDRHTKQGLSIVSWGVYDESEYTDGTGVEFEFFNPTNKTIKYITINLSGYNAVDDAVHSTLGKLTLSPKCIGPIEPNKTAYYKFEYLWFTDIVEYAKIKSIVIQYTNGTSKRISNANNITWTNELYNHFNVSILENFESIEVIADSNLNK